MDRIGALLPGMQGHESVLERAEDLLNRGVGIPSPDLFPESDDDLMGAIKIKDGLFIGDEFASQVRFK